MIEPSATVAIHHSKGQHIAILGTEGTIKGGKYTEAILRCNPDAKVESIACPLFVPLIEEGWHTHPVAETIALEYLHQLPNLSKIDTTILGCTHYPLLKPLLSKLFPKIEFIDSAFTTATQVKKELHNRDFLLKQFNQNDDRLIGTTRYLVTDNLERFEKVGFHFIGVHPSPLELVDLSDQDEAYLHGLL